MTGADKLLAQLLLSRNKIVTPADFHGLTFELDAVANDLEIKGFYPDKWSPECSDAIAIRLDGMVFMFIEDDNDGYRSTLGAIKIDPNDIEPRHEIPPVTVTAVYASKMSELFYNGHGSPHDPEECSIVKFVEEPHGKSILEIGTSHVDDYYPTFTKYFYPQHISYNSEVSDADKE